MSCDVREQDVSSTTFGEAQSVVIGLVRHEGRQSVAAKEQKPPRQTTV
jgi:hypothetical protein